MRKYTSIGRRRALLFVAPAVLPLILLGSAPAQSAASSGGQQISVFTDRNVTVAVTGGTATAINRCVNDASDGVVQTQRNSCQQAASAGNVVIVAAIKISASKNTKITVTGGSSTAVDECVNNASAAPSQDQENVCVQVADAENIVEVGAIDIVDSKNITIDVTGGSAMTVFTCTSRATSRSATRRDACTEIATVGTAASLGDIKVTDSKNVTITLDGTVVTAIRKTFA